MELILQRGDYIRMYGTLVGSGWHMVREIKHPWVTIHPAPDWAPSGIIDPHLMYKVKRAGVTYKVSLKHSHWTDSKHGAVLLLGVEREEVKPDGNIPLPESKVFELELRPMDRILTRTMGKFERVLKIDGKKVHIQALPGLPRLPWVYGTEVEQIRRDGRTYLVVGFKVPRPHVYNVELKPESDIPLPETTLPSCPFCGGTGCPFCRLRR